MPDILPDTSGLALGKLIGTVDGLVKTVENQNLVFVKSIDDQNKLTQKNRDEFMEVFQGMRADNKEQAKVVSDHLKDDALHHSALLEMLIWKKEAERKLDNLWDFHQQNRGFLSATRLLTAAVGGIAVALIDHFCGK